MSIKFEPELIIFDCDGTLVDSEFLYNKVISDILIENGLHQYSTDMCLDMFTGLTLTDIRKTVEQAHSIDLSKILTPEKYVATAQARMDENVSAIRGAKDLLKQCAGFVKICIGSNGERTSVIKSLKLAGLYNYFGGGDDFIFTKIQVEKPKPAPDLFLYAAHQMNVAPKNCLVIEDSTAGISAALAANMQVIGFTGASHDPAKSEIKLKNAGATHIFSSLIHIRDALYG